MANCAIALGKQICESLIAESNTDNQCAGSEKLTEQASYGCIPAAPQ